MHGLMCLEPCSKVLLLRVSIGYVYISTWMIKVQWYIFSFND